MRRWIVRLSFALNLAVIAGALALFVSLPGLIDRYLVRPNRERLISQFASLPVEPGEVVFLGDSITQGGNWNELFPGVPVRNRGIGGDTTRDVLARLDQVVEGKPAQVFLLIGTNDLERGVPIATILQNEDLILTRLREGSPGTQVLLQSVLPRAASWRPQVEELNAGLAVLAEKHGATWIDLYGSFLDADGSIRNDDANDELHLLGPGYTRWRDILMPYVRARRTSATTAARP
ncbi:MAG: sialate O-acetylesterase [Deltaproteobacteria bacterium]|nr:sialate O-acetylesterase [Deltaproteobacteria bacterium]